MKQTDKKPNSQIQKKVKKCKTWRYENTISSIRNPFFCMLISPTKKNKNILTLNSDNDYRLLMVFKKTLYEKKNLEIVNF